MMMYTCEDDGEDAEPGNKDYNVHSIPLREMGHNEMSHNIGSARSVWSATRYRAVGMSGK